jgi:hypothetical protein
VGAACATTAKAFSVSEKESECRMGKARCDSAGADRVGAVVPLVKRPRLAPAAHGIAPFRIVEDLAEGGGRIDRITVTRV